MPPIVMATNCSEEMRCALCLDSWKYPVEIVPCGHIYCEDCVKGVKMCPLCRGKVESTKKPNRALVNMSLTVPVKCATCGWAGTRDQGNTHVCGRGATAPAEVKNAAPPLAQRYSVIEPTGQAPWTLYGLSQDEYDQIMALFVFFDDDDSGELDRREVSRLARWLNFAHSERDIDRIFRDMDSDGNGTLSLNEFMTWLRHNRPDPKALYGLTQSEYNTVMMQFHMYDKSQNGLLDPDEFSRFVMSVGEARNTNDAFQIFRMIDTDKSGRVDLNEFLTYRARMKQGR